jgi:hypothetical protein
VRLTSSEHDSVGQTKLLIPLAFALAIPVRVAVFVAIVLHAQSRRGTTQELGILLLGMLGQAEPQLRHGEPVRLGLKGGRFLRQLEAALRTRPEFVGKFHLSYHPSVGIY